MISSDVEGGLDEVEIGDKETSQEALAYIRKDAGPNVLRNTAQGGLSTKTGTRIFKILLHCFQGGGSWLNNHAFYLNLSLY